MNIECFSSNCGFRSLTTDECRYVRGHFVSLVTSLQHCCPCMTILSAHADREIGISRTGDLICVLVADGKQVHSYSADGGDPLWVHTTPSPIMGEYPWIVFCRSVTRSFLKISQVTVVPILSVRLRHTSQMQAQQLQLFLVMVLLWH